jgi:DNA-binding response OmpR family regulator
MKTNVLVVDGDARVRDSLASVLAQAGYDVITAADSRQAAEIFDPGRTHLLILDLDTPFKHAVDSLGPLTSLNAGVPILIITNQPDDCPAALMPDVGAMLEKPVDVELLLATIDDLLAEPMEMHLRQPCTCPGHSLDLRLLAGYQRPLRLNFLADEKTRSLH